MTSCPHAPPAPLSSAGCLSARRREFHPASDVRCEDFIEEAIRAFGQEGYSGASLEPIASAVGIRKQTRLHCFLTKDALLEAWLQTVGERVAFEIGRALEARELLGRRRGHDPR